MWTARSLTAWSAPENFSSGRSSRATNTAHPPNRCGKRLEQGLPTLLEIDLAGARQVREVMKDDALFVFLKPPSWAELVRRLTGRGTEPPDVVERRLAVAREELAAAGEFDVTLVNTSIDEVCRQMVTLINGNE